MQEKIAFYGLVIQEEAYLKYAQIADFVCFIKPAGVQFDDKQLHGIPVIESNPAMEDILLPGTAVVQMDADYTCARDILSEMGFGENRIFHETGFFPFQSPLLQLESMIDDCRTLRISCLTDLGLSLSVRNIFSLPEEFPVFGCLTKEQGPEILLPIQDNLYSGIWADYADLPLRIRREAIYLGPMYTWCDMEEALEYIVTLTLQCKAVYVNVPFPDTMQHRKWHVLKEMKNLRVTEFTAGAERFFRVEKLPTDRRTSIYVAVHKDATLPKSPTYVPLWLGDEEKNTQGFQTDKTEPSIAHLNHRINECTGLYWIWKHTEADVIGLVHYRRYFYSMHEDVPAATLVEREEICSCLDDYDILLPKLNAFALPLSVQITTGLDRAECDHAMQVFRRLIGERQPAYLTSFDRVMEGHCFYPLNMLITRRDIFDRYCEWLFSFLIDAATELDLDSYKDNNRRIAGFFAERMLTVWLTKQELRIKEIPIGKII